MQSGVSFNSSTLDAIEIDGLKGYRTMMHLKQGESGYILNSIYIVSENRLWQLQVGHMPDNAAGKSVTEKMFGSMKIK